MATQAALGALGALLLLASVSAEPLTLYTPRQQLLGLVHSGLPSGLPSGLSDLPGPEGPLPFFGALPLPRTTAPAPSSPKPTRAQQPAYAPVSNHCRIFVTHVI